MVTTPSRWPGTRARRDLRNAWISLALFPVAVLVVMVLGDVLLAVLGYDSADPDIPGRVKALVGIPMVLLALLPAGLATWLGLRSRTAGEPRGLVPAAVGAILGVAFVAANLVSVLLG